MFFPWTTSVLFRGETCSIGNLFFQLTLPRSVPTFRYGSNVSRLIDVKNDTMLVLWIICPPKVVLKEKIILNRSFSPGQEIKYSSHSSLYWNILRNPSCHMFHNLLSSLAESWYLFSFLKLFSLIGLLEWWKPTWNFFRAGIQCSVFILKFKKIWWGLFFRSDYTLFIYTLSVSCTIPRESPYPPSHTYLFSFWLVFGICLSDFELHLPLYSLLLLFSSILLSLSFT